MKPMSTKQALVAGLILTFGFGAMAADGGATERKEHAAAAADAGSAATAGATAPAAVSDAQIAAIVVASDNVDIDAGKLAKGKTKNKEVKSFAALMITDHGSVNKQATALVKKLKVKPEENDTSKALKTGGDENMAKLKGLSGAEFDKAYVDHEVEYHQQVLDAIDNTLIPNAKNEELKALLVKTRPVVAAHLEHAKKLQGTLGEGAK
jgi:putative membrane protein